MFNSFRSKIIAPVAAVTLVLVGVGSLGFSTWAIQHEKSIVQQSVNDKVESIHALFDTTEQLMEDRVDSSIALLNEEIVKRGGADVGNPVVVGSTTVNDILIGGKPQANNFEIVDYVTHLNKGTATIFSKEGLRFVRVATNVMKDDGSRAVGTELNPTTRAYAALIKGVRFAGVVDILGSIYFTAYTPLTAHNGSIIGVTYVGYKAELPALKAALEDSHLLESGFISIIDDKSIRYLPTWMNKDKALQVINDTSGTWVIRKLPLPNWGLTIVSAYPTTELQARGSVVGYGIFAGGFALCMAVLLTLYILLNRLLDRTVVQLLGGEPQAALQYMSSIASGNLSVNIESDNVRQDSLMATLKVMQLKLKNMISAVQGAADEVNTQRADFESAATAFQHRRDEGSMQEMLIRARNVSKTLTLLEKAIARFKLST